MIKLKRLWLPFLLCLFFSAIHAQSISWMIGTWKGTGTIPGSTKTQFIRTITIDSISGENFSGTRTNELDDRSHARIVTSLFGYFNQDQLSIQNGAVLYKNGPWLDCSSCTPVNKITVFGDSLVLSSRISGCQKYCDGVSIYYRSLCDYDSATQVYLVHLFGTSSEIASFTPCKKQPPPEIFVSDPDQQKPADKDAVKKALAADKKRLQRINDSLNVAKQKEQQRTKDSLQAAEAFLKKRQQQVQDSINIAKKRQQQIDDSLQNVAAIAKQKEHQRIKDSLDNAAAIAKRRQQEVDDSTNNAIVLAKKRKQQIDDSLAVAKKRQQTIDDSLQNIIAIAKQKQQQRIKDSLDNAAAIAKRRQQEIDDSTNNAIALAKKRKQQIDDSIAVAKKRQQTIDDSLQNVIAIAKQKQQQRIKDSLSNAAILAKQRQQQISDSTKNAIAVAKKRQQQIADSLVLAKKRQQHIQDSLTAAANIAKQKEQLRLQDSINNAAAIAKKRQQQIDDSLSTVRKQLQIKREEDSISNAASRVTRKSVLGTDSAKTSTVKAFETRTNVLLQSYHIASPDILVELFDNAEIDGDRVSVYHNNTLIVNNQTLTHQPITFKIHADSSSRVHEFVMIAENLGTIPPNTALLRVTVGTQIYKVGVKTDLQTNAKIVFYYDGN